MKTKTSLGCSFAFAFALAACSAGPEPTVSTAGTEPAPDLTGTWAFALDASDVAGPVREDCAKDPRGADACFAAVRTAASHEKIRFTRDGGRTVWRSFGVEDGREELFLEAPVELAQDGPGKVLAKVAGPAKGRQSAAAFSTKTVMRIEILGPRQIAMIDPKKGRLVYDRE